MEQTIYEWADLKRILREGQHFLRYGVGAHQIVMREDPISGSEARRIQEGPIPKMEVLLAPQSRLQNQGLTRATRPGPGPRTGPNSDLPGFALRAFAVSCLPVAGRRLAVFGTV